MLCIMLSVWCLTLVCREVNFVCQEVNWGSVLMCYSTSFYMIYQPQVPFCHWHITARPRARKRCWYWAVSSSVANGSARSRWVNKPSYFWAARELYHMSCLIIARLLEFVALERLWAAWADAQNRTEIFSPLAHVLCTLHVCPSLNKLAR